MEMIESYLNNKGKGMIVSGKIQSRRLMLIILVLFVLIFHGDTFSAEPNEPPEPIDYFNMDIEQLLNVEVSVASKKDEPQYEAPGVVVVVPRNEIEIYGDRNLHQLLQRQPSIYTRGSYMYPNNLASFRGDMPTHLDLHNLILLNGRPIRESSWGGTNFPVYMTFPLEALESVELVRGPGSVLYGTNAFTGVVNLKSRPIPEQSKVSVSGMGGSYGYYETTLTTGGKQGDFGHITSVRTAGQDGYDYRITDGMGVYQKHNDRYSSVSGMSHIDYRGLTVDVFATSLETFHVGVLPFWAVPGHQYRLNKLFANAGYSFPIHDKADLEVNITHNLQESDVAGFPTGKVDADASDLLGELTLFAKPLENLNAVFGYLMELRKNYKEDDGDESTILPYTRRPKSFYAQGDYKFSEFVKLICGAQWNSPDPGSEDWISRLGIIITPFEKWGFKLLRGEAFRAPFEIETSLYDLPVLVGNENLEPEKITTYDAQIFFHDKKNQAALTYFNSSVENLIIRNNSVVPSSFMNGGKQWFDGIELEAKHIFNPHWHLLGSAMYQNNKETSDINPSTAPDYMAKIGTAYTWDSGSVSIFYSHFSKPPRLATEVVVNPEPDALNLISFNLRIDACHWFEVPKERIILVFRVENLLNEGIYVTEFNRGGNPNSLPDGPGTTFYAGLTVKN